MITVTNSKIAGFAPRWAAFRGFSILFDNPGEGLIRAGERLDLAGEVDGDAGLGFYQALRDGLDSLDVDLLTRTYLFCPLPPPSYHVTVWDGGNDGNVGEVFPEQRPKLEDLLAGLPDSLTRPSELTDMAAASALVARRGWDIRFRFDQLALWGNSVLVARLAPADADAARAVEELGHERGLLSARFRQTFGIGPSERYGPHVSLGYFANREAAQLATPCVDGWNRQLEARMAGATLLFQQASVYGFSDMATFFKAAQPS